MSGSIRLLTALLVASQILGGGSSSRLYTRVREERGLAYNVYAQYAPSRLAGPLPGRAPDRERRGSARRWPVVREELIRLRRGRVSEEELAACART